MGWIFDRDVTICALSRDELDKFLYFSNSVLIRFFEFNVSEGISLTETKHIKEHISDNICWYLLSLEESGGFYPFKKIRGFQIIQSDGKYDDLI